MNDAVMGGLQLKRLLSNAIRSVRSVATRPTALDVWAFVLPACSFVQFQLIGRLILSEVLALVLLPWLLRARDRLHAPGWLIVLWALWLVSQIVTDLVVGSEFVDWARGWAAISFTLVNLLAILSLASTPRRARIFAAGLATGSILGYVLAPSAYTVVDPWKFGMAGAVGLAVAAAASGSRSARRPWIAITAFAGLGIVNALLLYRSMSGIAFLTSAYLVFAALAFRLPTPTRQRAIKPIAGVAFYGVAAVVVYVTLNAAIAANILGDEARARNEAQSGVPTASTAPGDAQPSAGTTTGSNPFGPIVGGRAEFLASTQAIRDSPILGHGSWARDPKYAEIQRRALIEMGVPGGTAPTDPNLIPTHSYLLGSWVWAGFAGGLLWLAIALLALRLFASLYTARIDATPLIVFVASWLLWNIAFSPFGNTERIYATYAITTCLLGLQLIRRRQVSTAESGKVAA